MINKPYILNIKQYSFVSQLKKLGFRPFIIDWGQPKSLEENMDINDFILRLDQFNSYIIQKYKTKPILLGYCMGSLMSILYASKYASKVSALALLAIPWNLRVKGFVEFANSKIIHIFNNKRFVSGALLQHNFYLSKFYTINKKYMKFANDNKVNQIFVRIERWVNDNVNIPKKVFAQCLELFVQNSTMQEKVTIDNITYQPLNISCPTLTIAALYDSVVPHNSSIAISKLSFAEIKTINTGHTGLVTTNRACTAHAISDWYANKNINKQTII